MGIDVFFGEASFADTSTLIVDKDKLHFRKAVIATGARPADPGIKGLEPGMFLTNESVFELTEIPDSLAVIGGGPIGCELAQAFSRLGSQVIIFHKNPHIMDREEPEAVQLLESKFLNEGIKIINSSVIERVEQKNGKKLVHYTVKGGIYSIAVSTILVGVGRSPNIEGLNLEKANVGFDRAGIVTNDYLQTSNRRIFAAGDVAMKYKFTHAADAAARIVVRNALFSGRGRLSALNIPWCTYTDPEIAHVGMYQHEAEAGKMRTTPYTCYFTDVDRAITDGQAEGFAKVLVKSRSDNIVGATIVGKGAGELISNVVMAMNHNIGLKAFSDAIFPYPTRSIILKKLGDQYNRTRLTPLVQRLFRRWFDFLR
jgi:pyruvate/2-oxoglutarate dehydrogenase complex dihydrolipoamide dehydrogenase (E3) component